MSVNKQVFLAITMVAVWVVPMIGTPAVASVEVGQPAPEISADKWLNAPDKVSLEALRGKIVVVEFWATWCSPCRKSIPHLNEIHEKWGPKGVVVLGLTDEHPAKVKYFMKTQSVNYIIGAGCKDSRKYGVTGVPYIFVIDPEGRVAWQGHPASGLDAAIEEAYENTPPKKK